MLAAGSVVAIGCSHPYKGTRILTPSELAVVDKTISNGDRSQPVVERLLRASSQDFFDADGNAVDAETFIAQLNERRENLREFRDTGRIRAIVGEMVVSGDGKDYEAEAYEQDLYAEKNNFIAIDPEFLDTNLEICSLAYGTLLHEVAHEVFMDPDGVGGHSDAMHEAVGTDDGVMVAWDKKDFSFEQTFVYAVTDEIFQEDINAFSSYGRYAFSQVADGTWSAKQALEYYDGQTYADQEEWATSATDDLGSNEAPLLDFFGWNVDDDVKPAILDSTMYDVTKERIAEFRSALVEKIRENREGKEAGMDFGKEGHSGPRRR